MINTNNFVAGSISNLGKSSGWTWNAEKNGIVMNLVNSNTPIQVNNKALTTFNNDVYPKLVTNLAKSLQNYLIASESGDDVLVAKALSRCQAAQGSVLMTVASWLTGAMSDDRNGAYKRGFAPNGQLPIIVVKDEKGAVAPLLESAGTFYRVDSTQGSQTMWHQILMSIFPVDSVWKKSKNAATPGTYLSVNSPDIHGVQSYLEEKIGLRTYRKFSHEDTQTLIINHCPFMRLWNVEADASSIERKRILTKGTVATPAKVVVTKVS